MSPRAALEGCLEHLAGSAARLVMVDLEDLWLERRPQNRPGTGPEEFNFRRRAARTLEEFEADAQVRGVLQAVDRARHRGAGTADSPPTVRAAARRGSSSPAGGKRAEGLSPRRRTVGARAGDRR